MPHPGPGLKSALLVLGVILASSFGAPDPEPAASAPCGRLLGTLVRTRNGRNVAAFLAIPFARPPVGGLRFEPPVELEVPLNNYHATKQPKMCTQIINNTLVGSEDCLYLNLYTPYLSFEKVMYQPLLPVLIYFHGSVDRHGGEEYTHEYLLDEDIIYVVIQYRRGLFGWLSTGDAVVPGNVALKDLRLGLRWVQTNVRRFGGDPGRVTIFGQSVGGVAVHALMLFASHEGLFHAGISHSGCLTCVNNFHSPAESRRSAEVLAELAGCPSNSLELVSCLRSKTAEEIAMLYSLAYTVFVEELYISIKSVVRAPLQQLFNPLVGFIGVVLEHEEAKDRLVSNHPWRTPNRVPWLVGVNSKETNTYFLKALKDNSSLEFEYLDMMFDYLYPKLLNYQFTCADGHQVPRAARRFYLKDERISRATLAQSVDMFSDGYIVYGVYEGILRSSLSSTYVFLFDYLGVNQQYPLPQNARYGASHSDELYFFFPHPSFPANYSRVFNESDELLSRRLVKLWTDFATKLTPTALPTDDDGLMWNPFSKGQSYLHIRQQNLQVEQGFFYNQGRFWKSLPYPIRNDSLCFV